MEARIDHGQPIVVGIDGSDGAAHALDWALHEAMLRGVALRVVHAWSPPEPITAIGSVLAPMEVEPYQQAAKELLERAVDAALERAGAGAAPPVVPVLTRGYAPKVLLDASEDAQLLVLGTRGLGGLRELILGSVSHTCAHRAQVPLVIVPLPKEQRHEGPPANR
jgi:nucleotide-binding universal stress UspA family protein